MALIYTFKGIPMRVLLVIAVVTLLCVGCGEENVNEEVPSVRRVQIILGNTSGGFQLGSNSVVESNDFYSIIDEIARRDPALHYALTKRTGGVLSPAILSTNILAWRYPESHKEEIAVVLPDPVIKNGRMVFVGIRFSGEIVYFAAK
jgi:hypothetical protein